MQSAATLVHPGTLTLKPPYKASLGVPYSGVAAIGCATAKANSPKWVPSLGEISELVSAAARSCKAVGNNPGGGYSSGYSGSTIAIPFRVGTNGQHSITSTLTVAMTTALAYTQGGCPAKSVNYHPPVGGNSQGYCFSSATSTFRLHAYVMDLNNSRWSNSNSSYGLSYNLSYWENYTDCYSFGTPTCSNTTTGSSTANSAGSNEFGISSFVWTGATTFTLWTNGSSMHKADRFALVLEIYLMVSAQAQGLGLLSPWAGSAMGSINMATLGNGAKLSSITIS
jgi:hypothetical protein